MPAATSGSEDDDPLREARWYNRSIYLMIAMPYFLLGSVGFLIYRGVRKNHEYRQAAGRAAAEGLSCPHPTAVNSSPPG